MLFWAWATQGACGKSYETIPNKDWPITFEAENITRCRWSALDLDLVAESASPTTRRNVESSGQNHIICLHPCEDY